LSSSRAAATGGLVALAPHAALGRRAESLVAALLVERGFRVVGRNVRVGRDELDVLAERGSLLVVCEVRSRTSADVADPIQSIDRRKQGRVRRATAAWLRAQSTHYSEVRFDAASVVFEPANAIDYFEAAF
jgi:putative endonuclease